MRSRTHDIVGLMKGLAVLALFAQLTPQASEDLVRGNLHVVETQALQTAIGPVQQWLGRKLYIYDDGNMPPAVMLVVFPGRPEPNEATVTPTAVFVPKAKFLEFRSSFEVAEFLSHAAAHVRLNHAQLLTDKTEQARKTSIDLDKLRKEMEAEAEAMTTQILETADCGPGPCDRFGRLLAAARR
jgi:hypothetical protein